MTSRLREITGYSVQTLYNDRLSGLLARGVRRAGVRGLCLTQRQARDYLRAKGKGHLAREV